ncbi:MAG TPA: TIGR04551 family protein [Polyangiaceae bacterium LLY-WYZ-15_(1-7)]|mgnify:CR=1 FL=1|nr:hypothetical protein [Myxococcales bacterium]MAT26436.1 hypothetical protein [Sandaracinus sp.]HJL01528.1 TIGR04551 family protein [Polyangiaceae bacterium LLY-WYZ-15_(1-7)]MBJ70452.1 hypothetical protein [Sandaracinus sp.]HJL13034.1 TIGR04551 family protein [Polyangiaceae bacterium LLY-WYZ-15_(1-7)]
MSRALPIAALSFAALSLAALAAPPRAAASGFTDIGQDIESEGETVVRLHGALRTRFELLYNLDLDRGLSPDGAPLFPVPLSDPSAQLLTHADMRLRTDLALYVPSASMAIKLRIDTLDNLSLGSQPDGVPSVAVSQRPAETPFVIRRAYGEVLTPFGLLAVGRMGNEWGLGMLANGGDCADCDSGDAADRILFSTPVLGHVWAFAFDLTATGPYVPRNAPNRGIDLDPWDDVRTFTAAVLDFHTDVARRRRARAGRISFEYGAYVSHRWQNGDVPAHYLPAAQPVGITRAQSVGRDFRATAVDAWARLTLPAGRVELEAAYLTARIGQPSLIPGVELDDALTSRQVGAALETEFGPDHALGTGRWAAGLDAGFASGDPAPGFGALLGANDRGPNAPPAQPGDLDGPQAAPPFDTTVDNFRFHPDYRIDRILFREIVGTVTDAIYLRPHARVTLAQVGPGRLDASLAVIASWAAEPSSTPNGERTLGLELDPTLAYVTRDGFLFAAEYAFFLPGAAFDNAAAGLSAKPAQLMRFRLGFMY